MHHVKEDTPNADQQENSDKRTVLGWFHKWFWEDAAGAMVTREHGRWAAYHELGQEVAHEVVDLLGLLDAGIAVVVALVRRRVHEVALPGEGSAEGGSVVGKKVEQEGRASAKHANDENRLLQWKGQGGKVLGGTMHNSVSCRS